MPKAESASNSQSPLIWIIIAVIFVLMVIVFFSGRTGTTTEKISLSASQSTPNPKFSGEITRKVQAPPGVAARELIRQARENKRPYPLAELYQTAIDKQTNDDLADAHLLFFFSAREGHLPSILKMAEMSDPTLFEDGSTLLDQADPVQAYKWYHIASQRGDVKAKVKLLALKDWAVKNADNGHKSAQQLLLNFTE